MFVAEIRAREKKSPSQVKRFWITIPLVDAGTIDKLGSG